MGAQVGILSGCQFASLDGLSYSNQGRNLKTWWNFEDFIGGYYVVNGIWFRQVDGTGEAIPYIGTALRPGIEYLLASAVNDVGCITAGGSTEVGFLFGNGAYTFETDVYFPNLSTAIEEFVVRIGFGDTLSADQVDGAYFEYDRAGSGVNWFSATASNSARTKTNLGVNVLAGAWIRLKIVVNYNGTVVSFYINGVLVNTVGTNIPTGAGRMTGALFTIVKTVGVNQRALWTDWVWIHVDLSTSR